MANLRQLTGMRGVYLVAAELSRIGLIVSPTSRGAAGADILATDPSCSKAFSVQVKTNASTFGFWLVGPKALEIKSRSHIYVFVNIRGKDAAEKVEYYVVPSSVVAKKTHHGTSKTRKWSEWWEFRLESAKPYRDKWQVFRI